MDTQPDFNTAPAEMPVVREALADLPQLETLAANYQIATVAQYEAGSEDLRRVKAAQKRLEETRTGITGPMNAALKRVNDFFRDPAAKLTRIEMAIKNAITRFADEQERIQREEQRKADEAAQKERDRLAAIAAKAEAAGNTGKAEKFQERAQTVVAPIIHREPPKVTGISTRSVPKFEIVDASKLPREYLVPDLTKIRGVVNSLKTDANIPGVRIWMEKQIAAGAA